MEGCEDGVIPGGILNGFKNGNREIIEIGDITKNWVIAEVHVDYGSHDIVVGNCLLSINV